MQRHRSFFQNVQNQKSWRGGTHPRQSRREHHEVERTHHSCGHSHCSGPESDYELHEDTVQIVYNTAKSQTNIKFDEISNSQPLGDLNLCNKAGKVITQRFKLDSWACANLIPIGVYSRLFNKSDRDLKTNVDHRVKLIAANNKEIKQLGTVNLRVKAEDSEKVCKFYVVPDSCRAIHYQTPLPWSLKSPQVFKRVLQRTKYWQNTKKYSQDWAG